MQIALPIASLWTLDAGLETIDDIGIRLAHGGIPDNCELMMHCDGANGGTVFTDSSRFAHTLTAQGNVQTSTAQSKFGVSSLLCDGTGDIVRIAPNKEFVIAGDFTVDAWIRTTDNTKTQRLFGFGFDAIGYGHWLVLGYGQNAGWGTAQRLNLYASNYGVDFQLNSSAITLANNIWYHLALVRYSGTITMYLDGVAVGSVVMASPIRCGTYATGGVNYSFGVGARYSGASTSIVESAYGYIDEFRFVNGTAMWTADFTRPTAPYYRFLTTSPQATMPVMSIPQGTVLDAATPILLQEGVNATERGLTAGTNTYNYRLDSGAWSGFVSLATMQNALKGYTFTTGTNNFELVIAFASDGLILADISGLGGYIQGTLPSSSGSSIIIGSPMVRGAKCL